MNRALVILLLLCVVPSARGQQPPPSASDSLLVSRILLAEDERDASSAALAEGIASADARIQLLARRAKSRIGDPKFASRDSFPPLAAPPSYSDPAWRLRYRALKAGDCVPLRGALADSNWAVRLHAADLAGKECATDSLLVKTLNAWVRSAPPNARRNRGGVSWHPAAHGILALARIQPNVARQMLPPIVRNPVPWLRDYAARAAAIVGDTATLRTLADDPNDNVREAAIDGLASVAKHAADDVYLRALLVGQGRRPGYQTMRAAARALAGSPRKDAVFRNSLDAASLLKRDASETSRDTRLELLKRIDETVDAAHVAPVVLLAEDFDCAVAQAAATIAARFGPASGTAPRCTKLPIGLPPDAVALALGAERRLRVVLADSSGGGSFVVRLRGDVAPIMAARILELARSHYYDGLTWQRVEPDFVIQGGSPSANEYVGNPRYIRDELGTVPHVRGTVGMSTRGHDTGDGQWFVNLRDNLRLNRDYTIFGEVIEGIDVVDGVLEGDVIARIEVI